MPLSCELLVEQAKAALAKATTGAEHQRCRRAVEMAEKHASEQAEIEAQMKAAGLQ